MTWQKIKDFIFFFIPLRIILSEKELAKLGLTSLPEARYNAVLPHLKGKLLDIGCGENHLIKKYGNGVGVDIYVWPNVDIVCDTTKIPFPNESFDTVTLLATLNHIPEDKRVAVLKEAKRLMQDNGRLIITMINPFIGYFCHKLIWRWDKDQYDRGMKKGESWGLKNNEVKKLLKLAGFKLEKSLTFVYSLNNLFIAKKV